MTLCCQVYLRYGRRNSVLFFGKPPLIFFPFSSLNSEFGSQKSGFLSWDEEVSHLDIHKELKLLAELNLEGEEQKGERLVQYANEHLVVEVLINPQVNTVQQCLKNLLSSFTKHRHIIHAGYAFAGSGSWMLQDGTFSVADLFAAFNEYEVQRVLHAYERCITIDIHCAGEGKWTTEAMAQEYFSKQCLVTINPEDKIQVTEGITAIVEYISKFLIIQDVESTHEPSDIVGNIRFTRPTLYVFPGGQGDSALFGVNGFNMLVDGGYNRKGCFWDFTRHLDRLDAVLVTRLNSSNVMGIANVIRRKAICSVYPQIGHIFCNVAGTKTSPDGGKDEDTLLINIWDEGHLIRENLRQISLKPHLCFRDNVMDPINLYHKVGHGKLDMYVLNPSKDSKDVQYFMERWNNEVRSSDLESCTYTIGNKVFPCPLMNMNSICSLVVWQPNDPTDTITRILFPGSTPQHKIFEGLEKLKHLDYLRYPRCSAKSLRLKSEEKRSSRIERLMATQKVSRVSSQASSITSKSERISRSVSKEEKRRTKVEKTVSESRTEKVDHRQERVRRRRRKEIVQESNEKAYSELQETTDEKETRDQESDEGPGRPDVSRDTSPSPEKIPDNKLLRESPPPAPVESTDIQIEEVEQTEEVRESSMLSVESGIILADDRESSLEMEQMKKPEEVVHETPIIGSSISEKEKVNQKIQKRAPVEAVEKPKTSRRPKVLPRIDTGSGRVDTKYRQETKIERTRKDTKTRKEEPSNEQKLETTSEKIPLDDRTLAKVGQEKRMRKPRKTDTPEGEPLVKESEMKESSKRVVAKRSEKIRSEGRTQKISSERKAVKTVSEKSHKRTVEEKNLAAKAAREEAKRKATARQPSKVTPRKKKTEVTPSKDEEPVKKIITGAAMKAGVVAAAAAGLVVPDATICLEQEDKEVRDDDILLLPGKDDNLGADNDEEDRISDIANIPGVQELKIEDDYPNITDKELTEDEEKDSLILHEEGVIERVDKEEISDIMEEDDQDETKYREHEEKKDDHSEILRTRAEIDDQEPEALLEERKIDTEQKTKTEDIVDQKLPDTALRLEEQKQAIQLNQLTKSPEKTDKAEILDESRRAKPDREDRIKDFNEYGSSDAEIMKQQLKDISLSDEDVKYLKQDNILENEADKDDVYATLPSSAKLTDYKEKYEEKPVRGLFGSFDKPSKDEEEKIDKRPSEGGEEKELPSSLPVIAEKSKPLLQPRDVIKTPDEVDELPIHEEVVEPILADEDEEQIEKSVEAVEASKKDEGIDESKVPLYDMKSTEKGQKSAYDYDLLERVTFNDDPSVYPRHIDINIHRASIVTESSETEDRDTGEIEEKGTVEKMEKELHTQEEEIEGEFDEPEETASILKERRELLEDALSPKEKLISKDTLLEKEADSTEGEKESIKYSYEEKDEEIYDETEVGDHEQLVVEKQIDEKGIALDEKVFEDKPILEVSPKHEEELSSKQKTKLSPKSDDLTSPEQVSPMPAGEQISAIREPESPKRLLELDKISQEVVYSAEKVDNEVEYPETKESLETDLKQRVSEQEKEKEVTEEKFVDEDKMSPTEELQTTEITDIAHVELRPTADKSPTVSPKPAQEEVRPTEVSPKTEEKMSPSEKPEDISKDSLKSPAEVSPRPDDERISPSVGKQIPETEDDSSKISPKSAITEEHPEEKVSPLPEKQSPKTDEPSRISPKLVSPSKPESEELKQPRPSEPQKPGERVEDEKVQPEVTEEKHEDGEKPSPKAPKETTEITEVIGDRTVLESVETKITSVSVTDVTQEVTEITEEAFEKIKTPEELLPTTDKSPAVSPKPAQEEVRPTEVSPKTEEKMSPSEKPEDISKDSLKSPAEVSPRPDDERISPSVGKQIPETEDDSSKISPKSAITEEHPEEKVSPLPEKQSPKTDEPSRISPKLVSTKEHPEEKVSPLPEKQSPKTDEPSRISPKLVSPSKPESEELKQPRPSEPQKPDERVEDEKVQPEVMEEKHEDEEKPSPKAPKETTEITEVISDRTVLESVETKITSVSVTDVTREVTEITEEAFEKIKSPEELLPTTDKSPAVSPKPAQEEVRPTEVSPKTEEKMSPSEKPEDISKDSLKSPAEVSPRPDDERISLSVGKQIPETEDDSSKISPKSAITEEHPEEKVSPLPEQQSPKTDEPTKISPKLVSPSKPESEELKQPRPSEPQKPDERVEDEKVQPEVTEEKHEDEEKPSPKAPKETTEITEVISDRTVLESVETKITSVSVTDVTQEVIEITEEAFEKIKSPEELLPTTDKSPAVSP
ncbi:hypothetical protein FHG87_010798, partial [Trinorchestia longiramus]